MRHRPTTAGRSVILTWLALAALSIAAGAETVPGGTVSGTWAAAGSPYLVTGDLDVPAGQTLVIEPGVEVRFQGWYALEVHGRLLSVGTEADSIRFSAEDPGTGWHSLRFLDTQTSGQPTSELAYCRIQDGLAQGSCPANSGGGIYLGHAVAEIRHCLVTGNHAVVGVGSWGGGGLALDFSSEVTIADCRIENNTTGGDGGGVYLYFSSPVIENNLIAGNQAQRGDGVSSLSFSAPELRGNTIRDNDGVGVYLSGSDARLVNNRIEGNQGSGVEIYLCDPELIGNLIADNQAYRGGAVMMTGSDPVLTNNTLANNDASEGGGLYATSHFVGMLIPSLPVLTNNIVHGNTAGTGAQLYVDTSCSATLDHCDVEGLVSGGIHGDASLLEGNIDLPPLWTGEGDDPYAIGEESPCRDAGTPDCSGLDLPPLDLMGHERVCGGCVDMGAYEYAAGVPVPDTPAALAASLLPNHPNPFNPRTTLVFELPVAARARLQLVDLAGRRIATLWDGPAAAGRHDVVWCGTDDRGRPAASGTYLARLEVGGRTTARALQLVR